MQLSKKISLKKNDKVIFISTAKYSRKEELSFSIKLLESWGLNVDFGKNLYKRNHIFSGSIDERLSDIQYALDNNEYKAIFFTRGGYGSIQILDLINWIKFSNHPKLMIGFSDITIFHSHIINNFNIETIHSNMPYFYINSSKKSIKNLKNILFGNAITYKFKSSKKNKFGECGGKIIGGNLSILCSLLGSTSQINTKNNILFIEDVDEYYYQIERMIYSLKRAGFFDNLKGLVVGKFKKIKDNKIKFGKKLHDIILDLTHEYSFPIAFDLPIGHLFNNNPIIFNTKIKLIVNENFVIIK